MVSTLAMARAILVGIGIVDPNVCWLGGRRSVGVGASSVCAHHHDETHGSTQSKEQTHSRLVDARGVRFREAKL
jgi:hypothetical protein